MSMMRAYIMIGVDIINIILLLCALFLMIKKYLETKYKGFEYLALSLIVLAPAPILDLIGILYKSEYLATILFKVAGVLANISVLFVTMFIIYALYGELSVGFIAILAFLEGYLVCDIFFSDVGLQRVNGFLVYNCYTTPIGAIIVAILVIIFIATGLYLAFSLAKIRVFVEPKDARAMNIFLYGVILGSIFVVIGFIVTPIIPFLSRIFGPLGVLVCALAIVISIKVSPFSLMLIPHRIHGFLVFREDGIPIVGEFYEENPRENLIAGPLSAILTLFREFFGYTFTSGTIQIGNLNCYIAKKENILCAVFARKIHPEVCKRVKKALDLISEKTDVKNVTVVTEKHMELVHEIIYSQLKPFLYIRRK